MSYTVEQFPNKAAFILGTAIASVNKSFRDAREKYNFIEAFPDVANSVGYWMKPENAEQAELIIDNTKEFEHKLVYMRFDSTCLKYLKDVVMAEFNTLAEGISMNIKLPETSNDLIVVTIKFD
ncbi:hypothetical protein [Vibrio sp. D431a]|uniref:hypothetical protein n=1 Tax=Vibrio sp. D431a TaxID=2837388 RepID=UPI0025576027|nr:hypothetical protein [Vibrio sp. D431a]MDK9793764.1 hypothetical protein [Vibrio sp. D431a]